jgi:Spy/CpxP family protein refolding chaperone
MKTVQELPAEKRIDFIREFSTLLSANVDEQLKDILLPHQLKRFEQIRMQTQMRNGGLRSLEHEELVKLLGITDQQRDELKKKRAVVEDELRKKVEQLRKEALDEILTVLTPTQREKLKEMVGKDYEFKPAAKFPFATGEKK